MARLPRFNIIGHPQHVIVRGNNREPIFYDEPDYFFYLEKLQQACEKHDCDLHAYVLMTNHIHLLITPNIENGLSKAMQMIGRYYVQYFNQTYQRTGTLWEGRYKATLIDSDRYALTCYRYIELNPVRAKMVAHPAEYPWSSYRCNALGEECALIQPHLLYQQLGGEQHDRTKAYRALFDHAVPEKTLDDIREATNKAWALGSDYFKNQIEKQINRPATPRKRGGDRRSSKYKKINRV
ncbi:MAG: transposase [Hydrogenovibrio sp.]|uniref:transposase n=1 Tax=Hydrogenovibrio sp. TaxID=2065821 RepID=UPI00286FB7BA|nr:transposase [Hydrogenovibrio sp.]MDR9497769.1 transposase [Hydrogenovibrio sp.]